jgi:hypothetical protein
MFVSYLRILTFESLGLASLLDMKVDLFHFNQCHSVICDDAGIVLKVQIELGREVAE